MRKLTIILLVVSCLFFLLSGCRTNKTLTEKRDTVIVESSSIDLDTSRSTQTTKITIHKIDSAKTEITIHQEKQEISSKHSHNRRDSSSLINDLVIDNLTPKLTKIDAKVKKDSIKAKQTEAKEKTKQMNGSSWKWAFFTVLTVVLGLITMYFIRLIQKFINS